jgi:hypothetical protein
LCRGAVNPLRNRSKRQHGWPDQAMEERAQGNRTVSLYGLQHLNHFHHGGSHPNASSGWHGAQFQMLTGQQHSLKRGMRGGVVLLLRDCCISTTRSAFVTYRAMLETEFASGKPSDSSRCAGLHRPHSQSSTLSSPLTHSYFIRQTAGSWTSQKSVPNQLAHTAGGPRQSRVEQGR